VDADLQWAAKVNYNMEYGNLFVYGFITPATIRKFRAATEKYLSRICYLVAGQ